VNDLVSKSKLVEALIHDERTKDMFYHDMDSVIGVIMDMPVEDTTRKSKWTYKEVNGDMIPYCFKCGKSIPKDYNFAFCPHCGSDMQ
jgi:hypothetical protein